jgi:ankyrin repeat protein
LNICKGVKKRGGRCGDGGVRIEGLVDAGADVNVRGVDGNTPLHLVS